MVDFDQTCIFCRIIQGELPCLKVYEDDRFIAFLDKYPRATGHCLIVPKQHFRWVWDVPELGAYMDGTKKVAFALRKAFGTEMIVSHIIGDEVPHAHIWLVPQKHTLNADLEGEQLAQLIQSCF
ncbi:MAG: HIT domain-containing protein [Parachlamydia sp.]|nr:HIT domain-containing protein [Parachlamydia sp.]